jgi:hypothetical protein
MNQAEAVPQTKSNAALTFSWLVTALMALQALSGIALVDWYRDNLWGLCSWRANDLVTLFVAVPLLAGSLLLLKRGSARVRLVWLGMLYYAFYNNIFYVFACRFNRFFLIYVALFAMSILALIFSLVQVDSRAISQSFSPRTWHKLIGGFMLLFALGLSSLWIIQAVQFAITGTLPNLVAESDTDTIVHLVAAVDLPFVVTAFIVGGIWLWQKRPWGYVVAPMLLIAMAVYTIVLVLAVFFQSAANVPGVWKMMPAWVGSWVTCTAAALVMLLSVKVGKEDRR